MVCIASWDSFSLIFVSAMLFDAFKEIFSVSLAFPSFFLIFSSISFIVEEKDSVADARRFALLPISSAASINWFEVEWMVEETFLIFSTISLKFSVISFRLSIIGLNSILIFFLL